MPEKTVAQKLLIKPGGRVRVINPPEDFDVLLGGLPDQATRIDETAGPETLLPADMLILFAHGQTDLAAILPGLRTAMLPSTIVWVAYHKGTSRVKTDINRDSINAYAHTLGLEGIAMIAINDDWAALRLKLAA